MTIWIVQTGEPLPIDDGAPRLLRSGILASYLTARGHDVLWWAADFVHRTKVHRNLPEAPVQAYDRLRIVPLHSPGYARNISVARWRDHLELARRFRALSAREAPPAVIHCGFPPIEIALEAARYGRRARVPVVMDTRDLWPEIFADNVPSWARPVARAVLQILQRDARAAFRLATHVSGHAPGFVEFGLRKAGRAAGPMDRHFPFGYHAQAPTEAQAAEARTFWRGMGVGPGSGETIVCSAGSYGAQRSLDLDTPIHAARILAGRGVPVRFVLCGDGPRLAACRELARDLPNVVMPGWVGYPHLWTLLRMSRIGLLPYLPVRDFALSVPNKAVEYLSAALPIATSLTDGYLHGLLDEGGCGLFYPGRDPDALASSLAALVTAPGSLDALSARAGRLYEQAFVADRVYGSLVDYLEEVARLGPSRQGEEAVS